MSSLIKAKVIVLRLGFFCVAFRMDGLGDGLMYFGIAFGLKDG